MSKSISILWGAPSVAEGMRKLGFFGDKTLGYAGVQDAEPVAVREIVRNIEERVAPAVRFVKAGMTDAEVIRVTEKVLGRKCSGKRAQDWEAELQKIFAHVRKHVRFTKDPRGLDTVKAASRTLKFSFGDCLNSSILTCSMAGAAGYQTKIRVVALRPDGPKDYSHAIAGIQNTDNGWIAADATENQPLGYYPVAEVTGVKDFVIE